jgi:hypothetical protein
MLLIKTLILEYFLHLSCVFIRAKPIFYSARRRLLEQTFRKLLRTPVCISYSI